MRAVCWLVFLGFLSMQASGAARVLQCHSTWIPHNGCCYYINNNTFPFDLAQAYCNSAAGKLMQVDSQVKQDFIANALKNLKGDYLWIGGRTRDQVSQWEWMPSKQPFVYTNWDEGEPNYRDRERCVGMNVSRGSKWANLVCSQLYRFLCESCLP